MVHLFHVMRHRNAEIERAKQGLPVLLALGKASPDRLAFVSPVLVMLDLEPRHRRSNYMQILNLDNIA